MIAPIFSICYNSIELECSWRVFMNKKIKPLLSILPIFCMATAGCSISTIVTDANIDQWYDTATGEINITEDVEIEWWTWGGNAANEIFTNIAKTFSSSVCPNIKVKYSNFPSSSYLNTLANSSNHLPDLFFMPDTDFYEYAFNGVIWDFSKYITKAELDDVWEAGYERYMYNPETKIVGNTSGAGLFALPKDISTFSLCYNENLMKEACKNLDLDYTEIRNEYLVDTKPISWVKFIELGQKIKPYLDKVKKFFLSHYELNAAIFSNNADFFSDDGRTSRIEEPQFARALDFMHSLANEYGLMAGASGSNTTTGYNAFVGKNALFSFFGPWDCEVFWGVTSTEEYKDFAVKMVPVPYGPGADDVYGTADDGISCAQIGSAGYCISKKSTTTNLQRAAALKFCKWLTINEDAQRQLYQMGTQLPNLISMKDEYINFGKGMVTTYTGEKIPVNPSNLNAFIDVVDGSSETDHVTGKAKPETRILTNEYKTDWSNTVTKTKFWSDKDMTGAKLVAAYKDILQSRINDSNAKLGR